MIISFPNKISGNKKANTFLCPMGVESEDAKKVKPIHKSHCTLSFCFIQILILLSDNLTVLHK